MTIIYICEGCGHVFEEPMEWEERHGFTHGPFEKWSLCPVCQDGYSEAFMCDMCGEWKSVDGRTVITDMSDGNKIEVCGECSEKEVD